MPNQEDQDSMDDNRPIALRRKRRMSAGMASPGGGARAGATIKRTARGAITPKKSKKRVRFSDPGPDILTTSSSTGLTPFVKRTTLTHDTEPISPSTMRFLARPPRRRASFPIKIMTNSSASVPAAPLSGEIQIAPLRQVLDDRVKRRLRRNNLSDEINVINTERRTQLEKTREIIELKEELALTRQLGNEVTGTKGDETGNRNRIRELENELHQIKEGTRERMMSEISPPFSYGNDFSSETSHNISSDNNVDDYEFSMEHHSVEETPLEHHDPTSGAGFDTTVALAQTAALQERLDLQASHLVKARLDLEHICPGETALGLRVENADAKPILDALLNQLRSLKTQLFLSETALGTSQTLESNLRSQFNAVLQQLDRARVYGEDVAAKNRSSISKLGATESKVKDLESDADEKEKTIEKLQNALDSYRKEVTDLEGLVTRLEADHGTAMNRLRSEMDEAVADLECHVVAETRGRREAESESEQLFLRIRELEFMESELKEAVSEKQVWIRTLEDEIQNAREGREFEVGSLNVRIGELASTSEEIKMDLAKVETEKLRLIDQLKVEREVGLRTMQRMRDEMKKSLDQVEAIREAHVRDVQCRGSEVAEHKGLLTPVSTAKFRDAEKIEGYVEIRRGKSRKKRGIDSGIGILEEDEDEDMIDANM